MTNKRKLHTALEDAMQDVRLSQAQKAAILAAAKGESKVNKRQWTVRTTLIAAALCGALAVSALAASPTLRQALDGLLGGFAPYSREVEGVSVTDQGIQMNVIRSITDDEVGRAYLEIRDLTGDRLTSDTLLDEHFYTSVYDQQEHTLLAEIPIRKSARNGDGTATISFSGVWGVETFQGIALPVELLEPDNVCRQFQLPEEKARGTDDDRVVLVPEQTPMKLEGTEFFTLSSMGFDAKDRLHVQVRLAEGCMVPNYAFWMGDEIWLSEWNGYEVTLRSCRAYQFEQNGATYMDFRTNFYTDFEAESYLPRQAYQGLKLTLEGWVGTQKELKGDWTLTFPLEVLPDRIVTIGQSVNGRMVDSVRITAMNLYLDGTWSGKRGALFGPLAIYQSDGSIQVMEHPREMDSEEEDHSFSNRWEFLDPVEPEKVVGIALGYWYIPLEDGIAQPGYWLKELPKVQSE